MNTAGQEFTAEEKRTAKEDLKTILLQRTGSMDETNQLMEFFQQCSEIYAELHIMLAAQKAKNPNSLNQ